jgi:hypothetical protein
MSPKSALVLAAGAAIAAGLAAPSPARAADARPVIEEVSPAEARAGGSDFIVRVRGRNFSPQTVVRWNGADRVTAEIAPDLLTAMILAGDVAKPGEAHVSVFEPAGGASNPFIVRVKTGLGSGAFARPRNPLPVVLAFAPASADVGGKSLRLTVRGLGFTPLSVVRYRGAPRHTRYVSSTTLAAELLAEDLSAAGNAAVTVRNPLPGGGISMPMLLPVEASSDSGLDRPRIYPNPWRADVHQGLQVSFDNLATRSMIKIFTVSGALIKTISAQEGAGEWDLTDRAGMPVSGGAYVYLITDGKRTVEGKLKVSR